ncbi:MAG: PqqD family peptide modification chaperone [Brevundimonas sp.]|uniref:PqqD family peptide modification chaperone n=1 Tax=Brevundimonas sp. TaxID=1871086 RepID=UPI002ABCB0EE|nr:PqqD family peptide modification chaperone [Brevundimonas sp.]MDZ4113817.1 PqqD family peptide modification chaperone [Brevundimonas sp.]
MASTDLLTTRVDGEVMAMSVERGACYGLDPIGTRVWELVETPVTVGDLIARLTREYDVDAAVCRTDVCALLTSMEFEGMIRRV